ncbi:hypothetical protein, partial [Xanthomonas phaseoli]|uniref:hypothetical protein n=1 Tax=Xanthomonas phaseoli TaxID=1985254 RepID=UPI001EE67A2B
DSKTNARPASFHPAKLPNPSRWVNSKLLISVQGGSKLLLTAWVSGFIQTADLHPGASGLLTPFKDSRMWLAGFKPEGNRDK